MSNEENRRAAFEATCFKPNWAIQMAHSNCGGIVTLVPTQGWGSEDVAQCLECGAAAPCSLWPAFWEEPAAQRYVKTMPGGFIA